MNIEETNAFLKEFQNESNRATAILGAAYLDEMVCDLISSFMIDDKGFINKSILGRSVTAIIDSFGKRVALAYALGLLRESEKKDLDLIRKIRNLFAHGIKNLSFEAEQIKNRCYELQIAKDVLKGPLAKARIVDNPRLRFILAVGTIGNFVYYRARNVIRHREVFPP